MQVKACDKCGAMTTDKNIRLHLLSPPTRGLLTLAYHGAVLKPILLPEPYLELCTDCCLERVKDCLVSGGLW